MSTYQPAQDGGSAQRTSETLERARQTADSATESAAKFAKNRIDEAERVAHDAVGAAKTAGDAAVDRARHFSSDAAKLARDSVTQYPLVALGAAVAVGLVIGMLIRR